MKLQKLLPAFLLILFAAAGGYYFWQKSTSPRFKMLAVTDDMRVTREKKQRPVEQTGIYEAQLREWELTRDLKLGAIPKERLMTVLSDVMKADALRGHAKTSALGITWEERGPHADRPGPYGNSRVAGSVTAGRIRAMWVDLADATKQTVWVGGVSGGLWKTTNIDDPNATWTLVSDYLDNLAIGGICQDPTNTNIMYFGTGEKSTIADRVRGGGIWKSTDHGVTWSLLPATKGFWNVSKILCDAAGNVYVATMEGGQGVLRSADKGATWTSITPAGLSTHISDMDLSSTGVLQIFCGYYSWSGTKGYRYTANPATVTPTTWATPVSMPAALSNATNIALASAGDVFYALPANSSNETPYVVKSIDGGQNWTQTNTTALASGTLGLSSGQGWFCIALAVDPANPDNAVIGGLNAFKTSDGGATWTRVSQWYGVGPISYVHADHHYALWNGNRVLIANDGGIGISLDGGATFTERSTGLRIKQFYSIAAHPTDLNYFMGGTQDNGTQAIYKPGLDSAIEVTGGDGAFVHIDQIDPQYHFSSYVYNQYRRSIDGGKTWATINYSASIGSFINPTDYDSRSKKMYCAANADQILRWENPTTGSTFTPMNIPGLSGKATHISVSQYTPNRVFVGSATGALIRIDGADKSGYTFTNIKNGTPGSNVSCIATGLGDDNLLATYSNYGVQHVWHSTNGGATWTNVSGNLPDIPVRWAVYYPESNTKAIIATDAGVWETDNLNGASTVWERNTSFPIVRTDMIKYRKTDNLLAAGTHGRGIFTAQLPKISPVIRFQSATVSFKEATTDTIDGSRYYKDYDMAIAIASPPTGDANVTVSLKAGATATQGVDFAFTTNGDFSVPSNSLVFPSGKTTNQYVKIRIFDDAEVEPAEYFTLKLTVSGSTDATVSSSAGECIVEIENGKGAPGVFTSGTVSNIVGPASYYLGNVNSEFQTPLDVRLTRRKAQMIYWASELNTYGFNSAGSIISLGLDIIKYSTVPYRNLTLKMGLTTEQFLYDNSTGENHLMTNGTVVKTIAEYSTQSGLNEFVLDQPFEWDGTSNIIIELCYDNGEVRPTAVQDRVLGYQSGGTTDQAAFIWEDNLACSNQMTNGVYYGSGLKPRMFFKIEQNGSNEIATSGSRVEYHTNNGNYYFYTGTKVIHQLKDASQALGTVSSSIIASGNNWQPYGNKSRSEKVFEVIPSQNSGASYTIGLYYTAAEMGGRNPADVAIVKTNAATVGSTVEPGTKMGSTTYEAYGDGYLFTAPFTGFSKFFLVEKGITIPVKLMSFSGVVQDDKGILNWKTATEQNSSYFEVQKSKDGTNNFVSIGRVNASGNSNSVKEYTLTDNSLSELNYYRLKMVDRDGKYDYSNTLLLRYSGPQKLTVVGNPFRNEIKLHFTKSPSGVVKAELFNMSGAKVYSNEYPASDVISVMPDDKNQLSVGTYILKVYADKKVYTEKVIKRK
ncbi:MAG: T9SS type A sorting domain-containing protein [Chitinophagaceae bacterium]|nr:T9SS type A sorting domain-containing protein [Chitinophagaceae bacterium]